MLLMGKATDALERQQHLNYSEQRAIDGVLRRISHLYPAINKIILYGSKARGDFLEDSDIDLLFVLDRRISKEMKFEIYDVLYEFEVEHDVVISAVFVSGEVFTARTSPFVQRVAKEGITLWSRE